MRSTRLPSANPRPNRPRSSAPASKAHRPWLLRRPPPNPPRPRKRLRPLGDNTKPSLRAQRSNPVKQPAIYMMANKRNGTIYTGVTSGLVARVWQHREGAVDGFTKRYGCKMLVWYELAETMETAIAREKQIKAGSRAAKLALIEAMNPNWR